MYSLSHFPAGIDYEAVNTTLTFNESMLAQVVTIPIVDDLIVENDEAFDVTLTTIDTAVTLRLQTTHVTIKDNDSKLPVYICHAGQIFSTCLSYNRYLFLL